jgi:hypothetical protein
MKGKTFCLPALAAAWLISGCSAAYNCKSSDSRVPQYSITFTSRDESHKKTSPRTIPQINRVLGPEDLDLPIPFAEDEISTDTLGLEKGGRNTYVPPYWATLNKESGVEKYAASELMKKADSLRLYARENGYNTETGILVNMNMKSGKRRFFVVDFRTHRIIYSGLAAHGRGQEQFTYDRQFSNDLRSNCSSLGKYKIGKPYKGSFGLSYRLYGLEASNSNAQKRFVVLHAMNCIPDKESEYPICQTEGCPAVSPLFLQELVPILNQGSKPLLMWIYR